MRPTDPTAERLLRVVLCLESAPWPAALSAYDAGLLALTIRCEGPAAKAEVYRWFMREVGGALVVRGDERRARRVDAFHDAIATIDSLLLRFRAGLDPERRPNLRSMLVKWIEWRAKDHLRSDARHTSRRAAYADDARAAPGNPYFAVRVAEVLALLDGAEPVDRALRLVGLGHTVSEAARLTGASRQQIYRARGTLAARSRDDACREVEP